jgi:hypothetical protein
MVFRAIGHRGLSGANVGRVVANVESEARRRGGLGANPGKEIAEKLLTGYRKRARK